MKNQNLEAEKINIGTPETLASEMYRELKRANLFKEKVIRWLCILIGILIVAMGVQAWYHIHMWSQFDTVVVDSGEGGNANYVQGDNQGGIFNNGESSGQEEESGQGQEQGDPGQA